MTGLDDAGVDRTDRHLMDLIALHPIKITHAGHDGMAGEMALEIRLVDGDVLDAGARLLAIHVDDPVDQQEGIAVRQDLLNLRDIELGPHHHF